MSTIPGVLFAQAIKQPNALAIEDLSWRLSYAELAEKVRKAAAVLSQMGLSRGDKFAVWAPNCAEWIISALAGQAIGAVLVTLNTRYKGAEAEEILKRSNCKILLTVRDFLGYDYPSLINKDNLPNLEHIIVIRDGSGHRKFDDLLSSDVKLLEKEENNEDDISDIIFTSGTTGTPKGAMTTHAQNIKVFESFTEAIGLNSSDRYLIVNPFFHSFGYKAGWLSCLIRGAAIFPMAIFNAEEVIQIIQKSKITVMPGAPTIFQSILDCPNLSKYDISSLRVATTGATTIPVDLIADMHHKLGINDVFSAYGLTESTGVVSLCRKGDDFETIATTCGRPLPGTEVKLVNDRGDIVQSGDSGEIWVRGFNVMKGYLDMPQATAEVIDDNGWLKTGDIGTLDKNGYLRITDRKKDMVIVGGFNVYPAEVEKALQKHNNIFEAAVVGVHNDRLGEVTHAHVVTKEPMSEDKLIQWCRENMANYKVPRSISFHEHLPRNASGKVMKFLLKT